MPQVDCYNWLDIAFTMTESDHSVDMVQLKQTWTLTNQVIQKCTNCDHNHIDCYKVHVPTHPVSILFSLDCNPISWSPILLWCYPMSSSPNSVPCPGPHCLSPKVSCLFWIQTLRFSSVPHLILSIDGSRYCQNHTILIQHSIHRSKIEFSNGAKFHHTSPPTQNSQLASLSFNIKSCPSIEPHKTEFSFLKPPHNGAADNYY